MKVLSTGAAAFISSHVCESLKKRGQCESFANYEQ